MRRTPSVLRFGGLAFFAAAPAFAQSSAAFPDPPAPAPSTQPAPAPPAPAAQPAPAPAPAPAAQPPPPTYPPPPPTYAQPAPAQAPAQTTYAQPGYAEPPAPAPPPPQRPESEGFELPPIGVRVDPFLWLLDGKFALELEVGLVKFMSIELVPLFVVNEEPPTFNYFVGRDDPLARESNGWGPLAGTSIGLGFWLSKRPLEGTVLRAIFTNYSYRYTASDEQGEFDEVNHVERHLLAYIGSHSRWGAFTIGGGFGIGADLNHEERCFKNDPPDYPATRQGCDGDLLIKLARRPPPGGPLPVVDLNGGLGGVQFLVRFSLGIAID